MTDDEHLEAIEELASVFTQEQAAHHLLDRIGFPTPDRPVFTPTPRAFWRQVCKRSKSAGPRADCKPCSTKPGVSDRPPATAPWRRRRTASSTAASSTRSGPLSCHPFHKPFIFS